MKKIALAAALLTATLSVQAAELDYNYIEGSYTSLDLEGLNMDGFGIGGSVSFNKNLYGFANYKDVSDSGLSFSETNIGLGFAKNIYAKTDWINELSYVSNGVDLSNGPDQNDSGFRIASGIRSMVSDNFELNSKLHYTDVSNFGDGFGIGVGAVYHVTNMVGVTAGYDYSKRDNADINTWQLGARLSF
jgi:opacity protein-like surface antigen